MGGCASKPKGLDTRKMPPPAARKPHAPPEVPVAQEKNNGDENKEITASEPETFEAKAVNEEGVPVEVKPMEAKVEVEEPLKEERKEVGETVVPQEEKEVAESVVPRAEEKDVAETVIAKEEKKEEAETVVPKGKKEDVAEKHEKEEVAAA